MSHAESRAQVTLSRHTVHNPGDPRRYMRIKPVKGRVRISLGGRFLAESTGALRLPEAGEITDLVAFDDSRVTVEERPEHDSAAA